MCGIPRPPNKERRSPAWNSREAFLVRLLRLTKALCLCSPWAHSVILQAIKLIYFNWIMTPIFESVENPSPPPSVSPAADFQHPDSSRAFCPPCSPAATKGQRPICCNEFNMFRLSLTVPGQPERAPFRVTFHSGNQRDMPATAG